MTEVKPGYKWTEIGEIPEDWEVYDLGKVAKIIDPQPDHRTPQETRNGEPYIGIRDFLVDGSIDWINCRKIVSEAVDKQQAAFQITEGDIIFGKIGTIGMPKFLPITTFRYALSANVILIKPQIPSGLMMAWLKSDLILEQIYKGLHTTSQPAFGITKMRKVLIPIPSSANEQRAIADALSEVDEQIAELDDRIAKKRDIKQGAMQRLLTGEERLPDFNKKNDYMETEVGNIPTDWNICKLSEVVESLIAGVSVNSVDESLQLYPYDKSVLKTSSVFNGQFLPHESKKIAIGDIDRARVNPLANSIIISRMNTPELVGECGYVESDYPNLYLPDRLWMMQFKKQSGITNKG